MIPSTATPIDAHAGHSGFYPLLDAGDAFAARYLLASEAKKTLDVRYYIWRNDLSGTLLMKALVDAADRGVRVRLLLDDNNTFGLDRILAAIDRHPCIEVRLFNPFVQRRARLAGYLKDFWRLNRRMHNKSFTADDTVTIIGGRNVGDEYFAATDGVLFADLDVMAIGPVVQDVSSDFDRYWTCASACPAGRLLSPASDDTIAELSALAARIAADSRAVAYMKAVCESTFVREAIGGTLPLEWAAARMISDPPDKAVVSVRRNDVLLGKLQQIFGKPAAQIDLVSPYFVPTAHGVAFFGECARRGVNVRVLTNSLEATDVAIVHADTRNAGARCSRAASRSGSCERSRT